MKQYFILLLIALSATMQAQDAWQINATNINPEQYYGVTVANGMLGIVSSAGSATN